MSCCPPGSEPGKPTSPYKGVTTQFGVTTLYVAGPSTASVGLVALPDAFGLDSGRTKADADRLGDLGYAVVLVDVMDGAYLDPETDYMPLFPAFLERQDFQRKLIPAMRDGVAYLQQHAQVERICSYGYCYGSWLGARFSIVEPTICGHVSFHPSWIAEQLTHGEGAVDAMAGRLSVPQLLLAAGNDPPFVREGGSVHKILEKRGDRVAKLSQVVDFPDVKHGWVNRGELQDPTVEASVAKAWALAEAFFHRVTTD